MRTKYNKKPKYHRNNKSKRNPKSNRNPKHLKSNKNQEFYKKLKLKMILKSNNNPKANKKLKSNNNNYLNNPIKHKFHNKNNKFRRMFVFITLYCYYNNTDVTQVFLRDMIQILMYLNHYLWNFKQNIFNRICLQNRRGRDSWQLKIDNNSSNSNKIINHNSNKDKSQVKNKFRTEEMLLRILMNLAWMKIL